MNEIAVLSKESTLKEAELKYKNKDYPNAYPLYQKIWNEFKINDPYTMFKYGNILRNIKKSKEFIELYVKYDFSNITDKQKNFIDRIFSWCLYDIYIKPYDKNNRDQGKYENFISNAHRILEIQNSNNHKYYESAFVKTCVKVANVIVHKTAIPNYKEIIWWMEQLNVSELSNNPYSFVDKENKKREIASDREIYYQYLSKCYEKMNDYDKCLEICEQALKDVGRFHYRNHIWIKERKLYCSCFIEENYDQAIENYKLFAEKQQKCYMFCKLSNLYYSRTKIKESLVYGCKALLLEYDIPKIINLLEDLAYYWREYGKSENAHKFFYACFYYRMKRRWKISQELCYEIKQYNFSLTTEIDFKELIKIAEDFVNANSLTKIRHGIITMIDKSKQFGFIKINDKTKDKIYFNFKNVLDKNVLYKNSNVVFEIITNNRKLNEAINLRGE